ncbi:hypothetical protein CR513_30110, partial [Mucuna pruriens]
ATYAAVVELVLHTLVNDIVNHDIDVVADAVGLEGDGTILLEPTREGVSGARSQHCLIYEMDIIIYE